MNDNSYNAGMNTLDDLRVVGVRSDAASLTVDFEDGRTVTLPLIWFPRLHRATQGQRDDYQILGFGMGVHWPALDEDLSAKGLALGWPSVEFLRCGRPAVTSEPQGMHA